MSIHAGLQPRLRNLSLDFWAGMVLLLCLLGGCSLPGAIAPSTMPITGDYVEVGPPDEKTSCGYTVFMVPFGNPEPVSDIIDSMIQTRGGDALVNVSSESTSGFYLLGSSNCVTIRGTVVRLQ